MHSQIDQGLKRTAKVYQEKEPETKISQETAGTITMSQLSQLVDRAQKLTFLVEDRLFPIIRRKPEDENKSPGAIIPPPFPPMFEEIRSLLQNIENSLKTIEETMNRVEL